MDPTAAVLALLADSDDATLTSFTASADQVPPLTDSHGTGRTITVFEPGGTTGYTAAGDARYVCEAQVALVLRWPRADAGGSGLGWTAIAAVWAAVKAAGRQLSDGSATWRVFGRADVRRRPVLPDSDPDTAYHQMTLSLTLGLEP